MNLNYRPLQRIQISRYSSGYFKNGYYLFHNDDIIVLHRPQSFAEDHRVQFLQMENVEAVVGYADSLEGVDLDDHIGAYGLTKKTEWPDVIKRINALGVPTRIVTTTGSTYDGIFVSADTDECVFAIYETSMMAYEGDLFIRNEDVVQLTVGLPYVIHILLALGARK